MAANASESHVTITGRFVSTYVGAGVHHVAFSTSDIECTARHYEARQASLLKLPADYYADLSAELGVDDATLTGLLYPPRAQARQHSFAVTLS